MLRSLARLSAADASRSVNDGATIAAHAQHVRFGLSLMNRWARDGGDPFADAKWGEAVHAVVVLRAGTSATESELLAWCADRIAGYKRPKSVSFIADEEMPRTATGKNLHRVLKTRLAPGG